VLSSTGLASESYAAEFRPGPPDEALLAQLSTASGGRGGQIEAADVFDAGGLEQGVRRFGLQGPFLVAAAFLWPLAVVLSRLTLRRPSPAGLRTGLVTQVRRARASLPTLPGRDPGAPRPPPDTSLPPPPPPPAPPSTVGKLLEKKRRRSE
jgi:hypothetical protein